MKITTETIHDLANQLDKPTFKTIYEALEATKTPTQKAAPKAKPKRRKGLSSYARWSTEDDALIMNPNTTAAFKMSEMRKMGRTKGAVRARINYLKKGKPKAEPQTEPQTEPVRGNWTKTEDAMLQREGSVNSKIIDLMKYGRTEEEILSRLRYLGL